MQLEEKTISQEYKYRGRIVNLRVDQIELPDGKPAMREVVEHPGGVTIAALTDREELLFVRQFRYPYKEVVTELPAGKLEYGEDPREAAIRELREETGATAGVFEPMGNFYPSPGYCGEIIRMYFATELDFGGQDLDEDEFLEVERIPLKEAVRMAMAGELPDGKTQALVLRTYLYLQERAVLTDELKKE